MELVKLVKPKKSTSKSSNSINAQIGDAFSSSGLDEKVLSKLNSQKSTQIRAEPSENNWILNELNAQKNEINLEKEFGLIDEISAFLKETPSSPRLNMEAKKEIEAPPRELIRQKSSVFVETTIESLPTEILCKIMDYLDFNDRKVEHQFEA